MPRSIEVARIVGGVCLALGGAAVFAQSGDWRDRRVDGSSEARFEFSIAALQNSLPPRRREDFDIALAVIWMSESLGSIGLDRDGDGDVDRADSRLLADRTMDLLTDIQRGDLLSSIEATRFTPDDAPRAAELADRVAGAVRRMNRLPAAAAVKA